MSENDFLEFMEWLKSSSNEEPAEIAPSEVAPSEPAPSEVAPSEPSPFSSASDSGLAAVKEEPGVRGAKQNQFLDDTPKCPQCGDARSCI